MNLRIPVALLAIPLCSCSIVFNGISKGGSTVDEQQWTAAFSAEGLDNVTIFQTKTVAMTIRGEADEKTMSATGDSRAKYVSGEADITTKQNTDGKLKQTESKIRKDDNGGYVATTTSDGQTTEAPHAGPANPSLSFSAFASGYASYENVGGIYQNELDSSEALEVIVGMDLGLEVSGDGDGGLSGIAQLTFDQSHRLSRIFVSIIGPFVSVENGDGEPEPVITIDRFVVSCSFSEYGTTELSA
ncbi:MAG TPA: hypothetical protein IAC52_03545 [Candidatus Enteromonas pullicola]|uniref:Uncharacterized protein n=1 Tax=Candidatus Alloenteromonas pullicola TaxID=2840784 RepID=A0A9D1LNW0_9FIRM|nr:hypothetical protein [Candidatus Enteromonas pullicola]